MKRLKCFQNLLNTFCIECNRKEQIIRTKERSFNYDMMRIMMSLFVIAVHTPLPSRMCNTNAIWYALSCFYLQCNGVFS